MSSPTVGDMNPPGRRLVMPFAFALALACAWIPHAASVAAKPATDELRFERDGHARFPFELRGQHIWVRGRVNGADSAWIVIDTGAAASVMDSALARTLGLEPTGHHQAFGAGGHQPSTTVAGVTLELPGLSLVKPSMTSLDLGAFTALAGRPMQVIVGYELFRSCVVRFDYPEHMIDVWDLQHAPAELPGVALPLTFMNNHPYVEGRLAVPGHAPLRGKFVIDTGSGMAVTLAPEVASREQLAATLPRTLVTISRGVGGEITNHVARADSLVLGGLKFTAPTLVLPDSGAGRISVVGSLGNLGGQLLERCRVTFDYAHERVRFEPGPDFDRPYEADMLGAALVRGPQGFAVRWVGPETPAAEAGLAVGDVVTRVDGEPFTAFDSAGLRKRLQVPGRVVKLGVQRSGAERELTATLRRLL
jgi:predicted aspartyl protease